MDKKKEIKTTDWLTRGMTKEQIAREKQEAIMVADLELCMSFDLWMERETGETTVNYDYVAEKMYDIGYRKQVEGEWILKDHDLVCSLCEGEILEKTEYSCGCYMGAETIFSKYCPYCGAKMRKGE